VTWQQKEFRTALPAFLVWKSLCRNLVLAPVSEEERMVGLCSVLKQRTYRPEADRKPGALTDCFAFIFCAE